MAVRRQRRWDTASSVAQPGDVGRGRQDAGANKGIEDECDAVHVHAEPVEIDQRCTEAKLNMVTSAMASTHGFATPCIEDLNDK